MKIQTTTQQLHFEAALGAAAFSTYRFLTSPWSMPFQVLRSRPRLTLFKLARTMYLFVKSNGEYLMDLEQYEMLIGR